MADAALIQARRYLAGQYYFVYAGERGKAGSTSWDKGSWSSRNPQNFGTLSLTDTRDSGGLWASNDGEGAIRMASRTGQGNPNDAYALVFSSLSGGGDSRGAGEGVWVINKETGLASPLPYGLYFRVQIRLHAGQATMDTLFAGFGEFGDLAADKRPLIGFIANGSSNWKSRVDVLDSSSPVSEEVDLGRDPLVSSLLEMVIRPGETRFYIDGIHQFTSTLEYPPASCAKPTDGYVRFVMLYIGGNNVAVSELRFGMLAAHSYPLID